MTQKLDMLQLLSVNPVQSGCWWLSTPRGDADVEWVDLLADEAQSRWPGRVAVLDAAATLISNLRVWENLILPVWRRDNARLALLENAVASAFDLAQVEQARRETLVVRLPAMLDRSERRLVVLLRSVLIEPTCVIIEEELWRDLAARPQDSPHAQLFARLQCADCLIVVGSMPVPAGFVSVNVVERG